MKRNLFSGLLAFALVLPGSSIFANVSDNFNSRNGIKLSEVKGFLQGNCWFFSDFDVNRNGWSPNMEGDGAMVSGLGNSANSRTGIFSPVLDLNGTLTISFKYKFNQAVSDRRWIRIIAADANNRPVYTLDSLELTGCGDGTIFGYSRELSVPQAGQYKLYINYQGIGGTERIAIDQLIIGASTHYQSTCNVAPVTQRDKFIGTSLHTAAGNVLSNDADPDHESMTAYLMTESPDGKVELQKDGSFTFTPNAGFAGNSTQFTYKVCDGGTPSLCSINTTATVRFPTRSTLKTFQALYRKNAVDINWLTAADNHSNHFEVERSLDGNNFEKVGEVNADSAAVASSYAYVFTDKVHESMVKKNDLYYRLRQIDAAGRINYSKVLIVRTYGTKSVASVSVTPDPGVNDIQVNVQLKEKSFVMMRVSDEKGGELIKKTAMGADGANTYNIEGTDALQPGMYQLEVIINSNERLTMKLAKS